MLVTSVRTHTPEKFGGRCSQAYLCPGNSAPYLSSSECLVDTTWDSSHMRPPPPKPPPGHRSSEQPCHEVFIPEAAARQTFWPRSPLLCLLLLPPSGLPTSAKEYIELSHLSPPKVPRPGRFTLHRLGLTFKLASLLSLHKILHTIYDRKPTVSAALCQHHRVN